MAAENVDPKAPDRERVQVMWRLIVTAVDFFGQQDNNVAKDNIRRFLLHVAWHEGAFLKARQQGSNVPGRSGPGRSFFQFEPLRAKEAIAYANRRERPDKFLTELARVANTSKAALLTAADSISTTGTTWPASNLLQDLLGGAAANDLFGIYLARIAFLNLTAPIGTGLAAHAEYWATQWKRVFDPTGPQSRPELVKTFQREAAAVDKLIPAQAPLLAEVFDHDPAALRSQIAYLRQLTQEYEAAARLLKPDGALESTAVAAPAPAFTGILDTYHGNTIDLARVKAAGIVAIIHKATEGTSFSDKAYHERRKQAKALGLLWGCYHYSSGGDPTAQANFLLDFAKPAADEVIALDWEASSTGGDMTQQQARQFVQTIRARTGRWPLLYGGSLLRETVGKKADPILANCPLWYSRYAKEPLGIPQQIWPTYTLWQYTDGVSGPEPRLTPGVSGADRNLYPGTLAQLQQAWPWTVPMPASLPATVTNSELA